MHWAGSLFLCIVLCICIVAALLMRVPLRLAFCAEYINGWRGEATISYLWIRRTVPLTAAAFQKPDRTAEHTKRPPGGARERLRRNTSFHIEWKPLAGFTMEALRTISGRSRLNHLEIACAIGFSRPDITAYSYGLFWGLIAALPERWQAQSRIHIVPDFQNVRFELGAKGIIETTMGQAIGIMVSLARLWIRRVKEQAKNQNREEQIAYES